MVEAKRVANSEEPVWRTRRNSETEMKVDLASRRNPVGRPEMDDLPGRAVLGIIAGIFNEHIDWLDDLAFEDKHRLPGQASVALFGWPEQRSHSSN